MLGWAFRVDQSALCDLMDNSNRVSAREVSHRHFRMLLLRRQLEATIIRDNELPFVRSF